MNAMPALVNEIPPLRLGLVPYLNVHLMAYGLGAACPQLRLRAGTPRELQRWLAAGEIDLGTVPVFASFNQSGLGVLPAPVIAAQREVFSVVVVANEPFDRLRQVIRDPHSVTSNALLAVLAARAWSGAVELIDSPSPPGAGKPLPPGTGRLMIGDPAMRDRGAYPHVLDLALAWREWTGLPFVFAAWIGPQSTQPGSLAALLLSVVRHNAARIEEAAADYAGLPDMPVAERARYLRENISMRFGPAEREALWRFHAEVVALRLAPEGPPPPWIGGPPAVEAWDALERESPPDP